MTITRIEVLTRCGQTDRVWLHISLPPPIPGNKGLIAAFEVTPGDGIGYCQKHFPKVLLVHIDGDNGTRKFVGGVKG